MWARAAHAPPAAEPVLPELKPDASAEARAVSEGVPAEVDAAREAAPDKKAVWAAELGKFRNLPELEQIKPDSPKICKNRLPGELGGAGPGAGRSWPGSWSQL